MSIEQTDTVDFVNIDHKTGDVVLAISDHLNWDDDEGKHLMLLQSKLNTYLRFVESGELLNRFPDTRGRNVIIDLVGKFPMSQSAENVFEIARGVIRNAGVTLRFRSLPVN